MLKWTKIGSILKKRYLLMTFKALKRMAPKYFSQMFHVSKNQTYQLRPRLHGTYQKIFPVYRDLAC